MTTATTTTTNSTNTSLASFFNTLNNKGSFRGRFAGLVVRKKGRTRGRGAAKARYGDDMVHVVLVTGFSYMSLVERSLAKLNVLASGPNFFSTLEARGTVDGHGNAVTEADYRTAFTALTDSFNRTLNGTNKSVTDDVFVTLEVNGETLEGCRVYTGDGEGDPGSVYVQGLKIAETVIDAAPNGPGPKTKSKAPTVAKGALRRMLPISRYVSYSLPKGGDYILSAGKVAFDAAVEAGIEAARISVADLDD